MLQLLGKDSPLGEPIDVPSEFNELIESIRINVFGGLPAQPRRHLGEAQSCVILTAVHEYRGSWWVTDDVDAYEYAKRKNMFTYRTRDVFAHLVADGEVTAQEALTLMRDMQEQGRGLSMPANVDELTNGQT